jgi:hypothetical protein
MQELSELSLIVWASDILNGKKHQEVQRRQSKRKNKAISHVFIK